MLRSIVQSFTKELEELTKEAKSRILVPSSLKGLVSPDEAVPQFRKLLEGYRKGLSKTDPLTGKFPKDTGFLTHDSSSFGGKKAIEDILEHGRIRGSMGERAQYTAPGRKEVYWHRGSPGIDRNRDGSIAKMWFRGPQAEGIHAHLAKLQREGKVLPDRLHNLTKGRAPQIARTQGPHKLSKGDIAILNASERKNLPDLLRKTKRRGLDWSPTGTQQDALRASQLENRFRQEGFLGPKDTIDSLSPKEFKEFLEEVAPDPRNLPRALRWWSSAKPVNPSEVEARFIERLQKPYK